MPYKVKGVRPEHIVDVWPQVGLMLSDALARSGEGYTLGELRTELETEQGMLWLVVDESEVIVAALVATIQSRRQVLSVWLLAGQDFDAWRGVVQPLLQRYAKEQALLAVEAMVRPGLARKLAGHGWREQMRLVRLEHG